MSAESRPMARPPRTLPSESAATTAAAAITSEGVRAVPRHRPLETLAQTGLRPEAEEALGLRRVERAAWLPVRHRRVPDDLAAEAGQVRDQLRDLPDRRLDARAEVDRLGAVV